MFQKSSPPEPRCKTCFSLLSFITAVLRETVSVTWWWKFVRSFQLVQLWRKHWPRSRPTFFLLPSKIGLTCVCVSVVYMFRLRSWTIKILTFDLEWLPHQFPTYPLLLPSCLFWLGDCAVPLLLFLWSVLSKWTIFFNIFLPLSRLALVCFFLFFSWCTVFGWDVGWIGQWSADNRVATIDPAFWTLNIFLHILSSFTPILKKMFIYADSA